MSKEKLIETLKEVAKSKIPAKRKHIPLRDRKGNIIKKRKYK